MSCIEVLMGNMYFFPMLNTTMRATALQHLGHANQVLICVVE